MTLDDDFPYLHRGLKSTKMSQYLNFAGFNLFVGFQGHIGGWTIHHFLIFKKAVKKYEELPFT